MHILFYLSMSSVFLVEDPERNVWTNGLWSATKTDEKVANTNKVPFVLLSALFISLPKDAKKIVWHLFLILLEYQYLYLVFYVIRCQLKNFCMNEIFL